MGFICMVSVIAGCGKETTGVSNIRQHTTGTVAAREPLTIMDIDADNKGVREYFAQVGAELGLDITLVESPVNPDSRQARISTLLASGDPSVDIFTINDEMISEFKDTGYIDSLDESIISQEDQLGFPQEYFLKMIMSKGKIYSVPYAMDVLTPWINEKWLKEADIRDISTEVDMKRFLSYQWGKGRYAYGGAWEKTYVYNEIGEFINLFGGNYYDWKNARTLKAVKYMKKLVTDKSTSENLMLDQYEQMNQKFIDGKYGMLFMFSGGMNTYLSAGVYGADKIHMAELPQTWNRATYVATWQYALNNASEHKDAAKRFLKYAAGRESSRKYAEMTNTFPARIDVINQEDLDVTGYSEMKKYLQDTTLYARPIPKDAMIYIEKFGTLFQKYVVGELRISDYAEQVQNLIDSNFMQKNQ